MSEFLIFKTSSPAGDLLSMMPSLRESYRKTGRKCIIYQALNVIGDGYPGVKQPFTNERGESIMMGERTFSNLKPLLLSQEYIGEVVEFTGQKVDYDLDEIRFRTFTNQDKGSLHRALWYVFPEFACDLSEVWLNLPRGTFYNGKIIINFTPRFRNHWINYYFLKPYQDRILFAGLEKERNEFCERWQLDIPLIEKDNFYDLAIAINSCKFFMSNQTAFAQIAEGTKIPRLLETCQILPHVIPMGKNGFDYYHNEALQFYFNKLISE